MEKEKVNYQEKGNAYFQQKMFREAIQSYTQGIRTIKDKEELSLLYLKRAICYYNLSECIFALSDSFRSTQLNEMNIEALINCAKYSAECKYYYQEYSCYERLVRVTKDVYYVPFRNAALKKYDASLENDSVEENFNTPHENQGTITYREDDFQFPFIKYKNTLVEEDTEYFKSISNNLVNIAQIKGYGRGLVAKKNIKKGQLIIYEEAFLVVTLRDDLCALCLAKVKKPVYSEFKEEVYCSKTCKEKAWSKYLKPLSGLNLDGIRKYIIENSSTDSGMTPFLMLKIFGMLQLIEPGSNDLSLMPQIKNLATTYLEDYLMSGNSYFFFKTLKENPKLADNEAFDFQFYNETYDRLSSNCCVISNSNNSNPRNCASGLFPLYSFLNHDCNPNATWDANLDTLGTYIQVTASKDIKKGDQIFISYIGDNNDPKYRERRLNQYQIKCSCGRCRPK